jgi:branched-chain amino acid aminotransferase
VDHRPVGKGTMGPVVTQLRDMFEEVVRGRNEKYSRWIMAV